MPHFTIEYSANLDGRVDMGAVVELVRKAAVETGIFPLGGIRVRAIRCEHYAIADGGNFAFLDMPVDVSPTSSENSTMPIPPGTGMRLESNDVPELIRSNSANPM